LAGQADSPTLDCLFTLPSELAGDAAEMVGGTVPGHPSQFPDGHRIECRFPVLAVAPRRVASDGWVLARGDGRGRLSVWGVELFRSRHSVSGNKDLRAKAAAARLKMASRAVPPVDAARHMFATFQGCLDDQWPADGQLSLFNGCGATTAFTSYRDACDRYHIALGFDSGRIIAAALSTVCWQTLKDTNSDLVPPLVQDGLLPATRSLEGHTGMAIGPRPHSPSSLLLSSHVTHTAAALCIGTRSRPCFCACA